MTVLPFPPSITVVARLSFGAPMLREIDRLAKLHGLTRDQFFLIAISQWTAEQAGTNDEPIGDALPELIKEAEMTVEDISG